MKKSERACQRFALCRCLVAFSLRKSNLRRKGVKKIKNERARRWLFTENNCELDKKAFVERVCQIATTNYAVASNEIGESGTKHIHCFVVFENAISLSSLKRFFPRAHLDRCVGTNAEVRAYVVKDDKEPYEVGSCPLTSVSARRKDVSAEVIALMYQGYSLRNILNDNKELSDYIVRNYRNLREIEKDLNRYQ